VIRFVLVVLALLPVAAQAQPYVIDAIEVAPGSRVSAEIVRAETRLVIGVSYTEEELQQAVYRVRRLPFVLKASYVVTGRTLVITVVDIMPLFYEFDVAGFVFGSNGGGTAGRLGIGGRLFAGSRGVFEGVIGATASSGGGGDFSDFTLSYSAYDLFGSRVFASAGLTKSLRQDGADPTPRFAIGIPIGRTQTITGTMSRFISSTDRTVNKVSIKNEFESTTAVLAWVSDTTDDPYFARSGLQLSLGPTWRHNESTFPIFSGPTLVRMETRTTDIIGVLGTAAYYRPFAESYAGWARADVTRTQSEAKHIEGVFDIPDATESEALVTVGIGKNFGDRGRWEVGVGGETRRFEQGLQETQATNAVGFVGITGRHRWGLFRLTFTYSGE
jgi:hypothetical protein